MGAYDGCVFYQQVTNGFCTLIGIRVYVLAVAQDSTLNPRGKSMFWAILDPAVYQYMTLSTFPKI